MYKRQALENVESVAGRGPTKTNVVLLNGLGVDLRVLPAARWGTLLNYFTGSKDHNVKLREMALKKGLSLNEHAFTPVSYTHLDVYKRQGWRGWEWLGHPKPAARLRRAG